MKRNKTCIGKNLKTLGLEKQPTSNIGYRGAVLILEGMKEIKIEKGNT